MKAVNLLSSALLNEKKPLPELPREPVTAICAVTGQEALCLPRKDVIGKAFTDISVMAAPSSQFVSLDVFYAWNYGYKTAPDISEKGCKLLKKHNIQQSIMDAWLGIREVREEDFLIEFQRRFPEYSTYSQELLKITGKKMEKKPERMSSWFCDGKTWEELDRQGVRRKVFEPEMPEIWAGYATTSYKKHGSLNAKVNTGKSRFWLFEMRQVDCSDMVRVSEWWGVLNTALRAGIGRSVLESLDIPVYLIPKVGFDVWREFETWARPKYQSSVYAFLCYLLPSQEELKNEISL